MKKRVKLPEAPSELIRVALKDLELVQASPRYRVNMGEWHSPNKAEKVCEVCFAGSVIAKSLKKNNKTYFNPNTSRLSKKTRNKMFALNSLRTGNVDEAFEVLGLDSYDDTQDGLYLNRDVPEFKGKGTKFKKAMRQLADDLEAAGF